MSGKKWGFVAVPIHEINLDMFTHILDQVTPPLLFLVHSTTKLIQGVVKKPRSETEEFNLRRLHLHCFPYHCVSVLKSTRDVFLMSYVQPYTTQIKTLKCLLSSKAVFPIEFVIKSIVFQVLSILHHLQLHGTEFCHNDFKADNIMLERCMIPLQFNSYRIHSWGVRVVLIDAETVTGVGYKSSPMIKKLSKSSRAAFGFEEKFSAFTDLHLFIMELLLECKKSRPKWHSEFIDFLNDDCIPIEFFQAVYVTTENRLNSVGRIALEQLGRPLEKMLHSTYFNDILIS